MTDQQLHMKKNRTIQIRHFVAIAIAIVLFFIPFFWLKPGFVDLGGDAGRLYFLDPLSVAKNLYSLQDAAWAPSYAIIPYEYFLAFLHKFITSPTYMIASDHGLQLALGFFSIYLTVKELISFAKNSAKEAYTTWIAIVSGLVYIGFVTKVGWALSMQTQNQIFLNPLIFYLLLRFLVSSRIFYAIALLLLTFLYSGNFGYSSMPQIASFYPFALLFLISLFRFVYQKPFPWKRLCILGFLFVGLHAFHIIPSIASILDKGGVAYNTIFDEKTIQNRGVLYFDFNHKDLGKISIELFQPSQWNGQNIFVLLVPLISFLGFLKKPSKLLSLLGVFFAITLFLVSANITSIGVQFYRSLFYIPGFSMFRSFDEKWYFVYSFFYTLLFAVSFYHIFSKKRAAIAFVVGFCVIGSIVNRIYPFLQGKTVNTTLWQSNNVSAVFRMDPNFIDSIAYIKALPDDGKMLTLPLTFPYSQIVYGKDGGAYIGPSMIRALGGKSDFSGFWVFGPYQENIFNSFREEKTHDLMQLFSLLNIRYIFHNSDSRIMDNFPGFPYVYPGSIISSKDQLPMIKDQQAYEKFLSSLPLQKIYGKGFYSIYEIEHKYTRPIIYVPEVLYESEVKALAGSSYHSAFGDKIACKTLESFRLRCDGISIHGTLPVVSFTKVSEMKYDVRFDLKERKEPFLIILSEDYHPSWTLKFDGMKNKDGVTHIGMNGYANSWIIEPQKIGNDGNLKGSIHLGFQRYYIYGRMLSRVTVILLTISILYRGIRRRYGEK
jgi:hypothetical protein